MLDTPERRSDSDANTSGLDQKMLDTPGRRSDSDANMSGLDQKMLNTPVRRSDSDVNMSQLDQKMLKHSNKKITHKKPKDRLFELLGCTQYQNIYLYSC